jgi:hypothetical protein
MSILGRQLTNLNVPAAGAAPPEGFEGKGKEGKGKEGKGKGVGPPPEGGKSLYRHGS